MKQIGFALVIGAFALPLHAGNPNRVGEAGATQLNVNSWTRNAGFHGANVADVQGIEAIGLNPAALMSIRGLDFAFARTNWLGGSGTNINNFGLGIRLGGPEGANVISLGVQSFDFGDIQATTVGSPEVGAATYTVNMLNLGIGYAHRFSESINAGFTTRIITEGISNASASGVAFDAGIQYLTGRRDQIKFSVTLRNIGPALRYGGDALSVRAAPEGGGPTLTVENRSKSFEMPSVLSIGGSYDFLNDSFNLHKLTGYGTFHTNAFARDQGTFGVEYTFKRVVSIRGGFLIEDGIFNDKLAATPYTGPAGGASLNLPFGKDNNRRVGIDYAYRATRRFSGTHSFGLRLSL